MRNYIILFISIITYSAFSQVQLLNTIGINNEPLDSDSICSITPRAQGNPWTQISIGDTMADFKLFDINGDSIILSEVLNSGKRVLMIAGSYTCPIFRDHMSDLNAVAAQYGNDIECFSVYTAEAHPTASPMPSSGNINPTNPPYHQPNTYGERKTILQDLYNGANGPPSGNYIPVTVNVPIYIDGTCNEWWQYYNGPNNAYLIDTNGILFAYHNWFNNSNPPNGSPTNIWCDIDSMLNVNSGLCTSVTSLSGTFDFQIKPYSSIPTYGNPGDIIDIFGEIINNSNDGVKVEIRRVMNNLPSNSWESSMCISVCLPPDQDTTSVVIAAGDTLDFSFHFFTDPLMNGPDTARARVRFSNANGNQQYVMQNYRGITNKQTSLFENDKRDNDIINRYDINGRQNNTKSNQIQIIIYEDGTIRKELILDNN